jgi:Protein of unknown function (DUF4231)
VSRITNPFKRLWQFIQRSLKTPGQKRRAEATCLRREIEHRVGEADNDRQDCFLVHRFEATLLRHRKWGPWYGRIFTGLSLLAIAAGAVSSALSSDPETATDRHWYIFALGLAVAITTAINQLWKPGMRSVASHRAGNALLREGWDFVKARGRYRDAEAARQTFGRGRGRHQHMAVLEREKAFGLFVDQIREIQAQVDAIDEVQAEALSGDADRSQGDDR